MRRWREDEFVLLISQAILLELAEKLQEHGIQQERIQELLTAVTRLAEWIEVPPEAVTPVISADPDDDQILACAVVGKADYLITYDPHFDVLGGAYQGIRITKALPFLWTVRGDQPPNPHDPTT